MHTNQICFRTQSPGCIVQCVSLAVGACLFHIVGFSERRLTLSISLSNVRSELQQVLHGVLTGKKCTLQLLSLTLASHCFLIPSRRRSLRYMLLQSGFVVYLTATLDAVPKATRNRISKSYDKLQQ
ncbi:hypothetical protein O3P69_002170 [Scylla paramamosain]|uniref:Uncharacterized protein n=1 Tax=Scylla paramamosain TaxID=85552 RepID=A0AAW0V753_SCYPA